MGLVKGISLQTDKPHVCMCNDHVFIHVCTCKQLN